MLGTLNTKEMDWENYKSKADAMFCEAYDIGTERLENHTKYNKFINMINRNVSWFEIKTKDYSRVINWLKNN